MKIVIDTSPLISFGVLNHLELLGNNFLPVTFSFPCLSPKIAIPASERIVYDFTGSSMGKRIGPLYDVLYDSLVRVIAGPDSTAMIKEEDK
jgi:hypothetical protein